jgi:hypothetical protein
MTETHMRHDRRKREQNRASTRLFAEMKLIVGSYRALLLIILVVLLLVGSFPIWPYSAGWDYYPTGARARGHHRTDWLSVALRRSELAGVAG